MTSLQFTGTTDINKTNSWKFAKKHAEHDPRIHHKNQNIDSTKTHLNAHYVYSDKDEILENHWHDYIEDHDQKMIARRDKKKCYGTAENYFNQKGKKLDSTTVSTFGNVDQWNDLKKVIIDRCGDTPETEQRLANAVNNGVDSYVQTFNTQYQSFQITEALTNIDEAGAPHFHGQMVNLGTTKTGRPSASFDRALLQATGDPDSKTRLSTFRQQTDEMLIRSMGLNFAREFSNEFPEWMNDVKTGKSPFEFIRTNSQSVGIDHDVYVQTKAQATKDAQQENKQLKSENDALTLQISAKQAKLDDLSNAVEQYQDLLNNVKDETQQAFNEDYGARLSALQQREQEQDKRQKEQDEREQRLAKQRERIEDVKSMIFDANHENVQFVADQIGTLSNLDDDDAFMVASGDAGLDDYGLSDKHLTGMGASLKLYSEAQHSDKMKALRKRNDFTKQQAHKKQQSNDFEL